MQPVVAASAFVNVVLVVAIVAVVVGALLGFRYAAKVHGRAPSGVQGERIDPFAVGEPWRRYVSDALQAQSRLDRALTGTRTGPLRSRLEGVARQLQEGTRESWEVARRGHALDKAIDATESGSARAELDRITRMGERAASERADALRARLASHDRLAQLRTDALERLRVLTARLDEVVARSAELAVRADGDAEVARGLELDAEGVVLDLEALRQALDETTPGSAPA